MNKPVGSPAFPISTKGRNNLSSYTTINQNFNNDFDEREFKQVVNFHANNRISQRRPGDEGKTFSIIASEIYVNIFDYWRMTKQGYEFDFPITDLV